jgi:hypothetical protein
MSVKYNGISFVYPLTTTHIMGPVKDPSGSDQLYTEITLAVESILNVALLPAKVTDGSVGNVLTSIRHYLTQPRAAFYYDLTSIPGNQGNAPVINIPDGRDDGTGPWPDEKGFSVTYTTPDTLKVKWSCTVKIRDCGDPNLISTPLSLRWEDSIGWDATGRATYTRNGTCILSSKSDQTIDWYRRNKLAPPTPFGFRRASSKFTISRDYLRCDFTVVDEQIRFAPPANAVKMKITQSESAPIGPIRRGQVTVTLTGLQNSSVLDLSRWALLIMTARVQAAGPLVAGVNGSTSILGVVALQTDEDTDNVDVVASCTYKTDPGKGRQIGLVGGIAQAWVAAANALQIAGPFPRRTQQGLPPGLPKFPWVGVGTSGASQYNPTGFASWANPTAAISGPVDGVGLAQAVTMFGALLNDPCGAELRAAPDAAPFTNEIRTQPNQYNTLFGGGKGGESQTQESQLQVSLSTLNASQYPSTIPIETADALWVRDGTPGIYDLWQTSDEYADDPGRMIVPTCSPGGKNTRIDYSSQMYTLYRKWTAKRTGSPPQIPPQVVNKPSGDVDPNWLYVGGSPAPAVRELGIAADGVNIIYEASGIYIFQAVDGQLVSINATIPPFMDPVIGGNVAGWIGNAQLVAEGLFTNGSSGSLFSFGGSVSSPLGSVGFGISIFP